MFRSCLLLSLLSCLLLNCGASAAQPNIVVILADDLGWGDLSCYNPKSKITTPNLDRFAAQGMRFTDAHSGSSVCTPTRYGLLTGRYSWRSPLKSGVLGGFSPRLIEKDRVTVASFLKKHGYATACIGKWHLGLDFPLKEGGIAKDYPDAWKVDYSKRFQNGPLSVGFDRFYGISASLDMPPYVFLDGDKPTAIPVVNKKWIREGPAAKDFEAIDVLDVLKTKSIDWILDKRSAPFFLYIPLASPHTPILPTKEFTNKSKLSDYGDFVLQTDAAIGEILKALETAKVADNTVVIITSDNGCAPAAGFADLVKKGHLPSGPYRGHKADIFEGGHRVPFLVRWPGKIKPDSVSEQTICLTDLLATCAGIVEKPLPEDAGEDSYDLGKVLTGQESPAIREATVHHSVNGSFAIRQGKWKLCLCPDSGGWSSPRPGKDSSKDLPAVQLYDLQNDPGEKDNVQATNPTVVKRLTTLLEKYVAEGRSTPGKAQKNTTPVDIWRKKKS